MAAKSKLQKKTDDASRIPVFWDIVKALIKRNLGLTKMTLKDPDVAKLQPAMARLKKPAEFWFTVDGNKFTVDVRVGTDKADRTVLGTFDLASEQDIAVRRATFDALFNSFELVDKAQFDAFQKANPDPQALEAAKTEVYRLDMDLKSDKADRKAINAFTNYDVDGRAAGYDVSELMRLWLEEKHQSWVHYVNFIKAVDSGADPKTIFDSYMKQGASSPINLPPKFQTPVERAIANGAAVDLKPARGAVVQIVNAKFIPLFRKERLALYDKDIKEETTKLNAAKKKYTDLGGK
jgi:hypothetical protein